MTAATMTLGGPLSIPCSTCKAAAGRICTTERGTPVSPHVPRAKAASPVEEVGAGDLVLVQLTPGRGAKHLLALLVEPGETPLVRLWRGGPGAFASPRRVVRSVLLRRAPEEDPRVALARAFLVEERSKATGLTPRPERFSAAELAPYRGAIERGELRIVSPAEGAIPPIPASVPRTAPKGW